MFTPLTREQYQKAIDSGFEPDQIIKFEQQRKQQSTPLAPKPLTSFTPIKSSENAGWLEKGLKGTANLLGKFGSFLGEKVATPLGDMGQQVLTLPNRLLPNSRVRKEGFIESPVTGEKLKPWYTSGVGIGDMWLNTPKAQQAKKEGTLGKQVLQSTGESVQRGAEIAPWLLPGGEFTGLGAKAGFKAIAKASVPLATAFSASGAIRTTGEQMQSGEYDPYKIAQAGITEGAIGFGAELGLRGLATKFKSINPKISDSQSIKMAQQAVEDTKKIFRPTPGEMKNIEFKQHKNIDDGVASILENVDPKNIAKDATNKRLDTSVVYDDMTNAIKNYSNEATKIYEQNPRIINIREVEQQAIKTSKGYGTALEEETMAKQIQNAIEAEITRNGGSPLFSSAEISKITSQFGQMGKFNKGYVNIPNMVESMRSLNIAMRGILNRTYTDVADITAINKAITNAYLGRTLVENAHNRFVAKGVNPMAKLAIIMGAHRVPWVGPILAEKAVSALDAGIHNPERLLTKAKSAYLKSGVETGTAKVAKQAEKAGISKILNKGQRPPLLLQGGKTKTPTTYGVRDIPLKKETLSTITNREISRNIKEAVTPKTLLKPSIKPQEAQGKTLLKQDPLIQKAKKYKSAEEFYNAKGLSDEYRNAGIRGNEQFTKFWEKATGKKANDSYMMSHRPTKSGDFASDITKTGETMPKDFYQHPEYYAQINQPGDYGIATRESLSVLQKIKGNPNADITIYRASPSDKLNNGDWVTLSKKYAQLSQEGKETIHAFKIKAKDVHFAGDDINEFGYFGKSQLTDIWNKAQDKKLK